MSRRLGTLAVVTLLSAGVWLSAPLGAEGPQSKRSTTQLIYAHLKPR